MNLFARITLVALFLLASGCNSPVDLNDPSKDAANGWQPVWGDAASAPLRPGRIIGDGTSSCTAGFLFVDPVAELYYLGTAAHCANTESSEDGTGVRITLDTRIGSVLSLPQTSDEIGTVVFDSDSPVLQEKFGVDVNVDFALVLLDPDVNLLAHPQVVAIDAPTGFVDCTDIATGDRISYYGNGLVYGDTEQTRKREGALVMCERGTFITALTVISGDSGGPAVYNSGGKALGIVSAIDLTTFIPGTIIGCTIPYCLSEAAKAGFGNVALATMNGGFVGLTRQTDNERGQ